MINNFNSIDLTLADRLDRLSSAVGGVVRPYRSLDQLDALPLNLKQTTIEAIEKQLALIAEVLPENPGRTDLEPSEEKAMFSKAIRAAGLRAADDIDKIFIKGDIIEVYTREFIQLYRNLVFMKFSSFDLLTLATTPFIELYSRPTEVQDQLVSFLMEAFELCKHTTPFAVPTHILRERAIDSRTFFEVNPKWISPLRDSSGDLKALVLTNTCRRHDLKPLSQ